MAAPFEELTDGRRVSYNRTIARPRSPVTRNPSGTPFQGCAPRGSVLPGPKGAFLPPRIARGARWVLVLFLLTPLLLPTACGRRGQPDEIPERPRIESQVPRDGRVHCRVCGSDVAVEEALAYVYEGQVVYFSKSECLEKFKEKPRDYARSPSRRP